MFSHRGTNSNQGKKQMIFSGAGRKSRWHNDKMLHTDVSIFKTVDFSVQFDLLSTCK